MGTPTSTMTTGGIGNVVTTAMVRVRAFVAVWNNTLLHTKDTLAKRSEAPPGNESRGLTLILKF